MLQELTPLPRNVPDFDCCSSATRDLCPCFPVSLEGDPFFSRLNRTCMHLTRSHVNCRSPTPWAEQFGGITSYVDASVVYGSEARTQMMLRGGEARRKGGRMWTQERLGDFKLPQRKDLGERGGGGQFMSLFGGGGVSQTTALSWLRREGWRSPVWNCPAGLLNLRA